MGPKVAATAVNCRMVGPVPGANGVGEGTGVGGGLVGALVGGTAVDGRLVGGGTDSVGSAVGIGVTSIVGRGVGSTSVGIRASVAAGGRVDIGGGVGRGPKVGITAGPCVPAVGVYVFGAAPTVASPPEARAKRAAAGLVPPPPQAGSSMTSALETMTAPI